MKNRVVVRYISDQKSLSGVLQVFNMICEYVINQSCRAVSNSGKKSDLVAEKSGLRVGPQNHQ